MNRHFNPDGNAKPGGAYSHGVETPTSSRTLYAAGQVGRAPDGSVPDGIRAQTELAWANLINVLEGAGMGMEDLVKTTAMVVDPDDLEGFREVNDRVLGEHLPTSTLMVLARLARPELLVEIEGIAVKD